MEAHEFLLGLDSRGGWPADLRVLLARYPREVWPEHTNLGETARFWLARHDMFRELGATLRQATGDFQEDRLSADQFRAFFAPRLKFFLESLEGHHHIEDLHYFPVFRAAEARLARGFDVLEQDHATIHAAILGTVDAANDLLRRMGDEAQTAGAAQRYAETSGRLLDSLTRHLGDEEDLIIPVILDQGERELFQ